MSLTDLPSPNFTGADLATRLNAGLRELRAARRFATVAALLADTTLAYGAGARAVAEGDIIEAGGFRYEVAASGASDHHTATAGGVRLYVLYPATGAFPFEALGPAKDGVTDDLALLNAAIVIARADGREEIDLGGGDLYLSADPTDYKFVHLIGHNLTVTGGASTDFAVNDNLYSYNTTPAAAGSTGGTGGNRSWLRKLSGSPAAMIFERTDVAGQPVVFGRLQANHDGFLVTADSRKGLIFGVNDAQTDEGCFTGLTISKSSVLFNAERRDVDVLFYTQADTQSLFIDGASGEVRVRNSAVSTLSVQSTGVDSRAQLWLQNDARAWTVQVHTTDSFRINDQTGNGNIVLLPTGMAAGALTMEAPGTLYLQGFPTKKLKLVDAGDVGGTEAGWVQIAIGGVTHYLRAYTTK